MKRRVSDAQRKRLIEIGKRGTAARLALKEPLPADAFQHFTYYAANDPINPAAITLWRQEKARQNLVAWPSRAKYAPVLPEIPEHITDPVARSWFEIEWAKSPLGWPWHDAVRAAIDADPPLAAARFARITGRCCMCAKADEGIVCAACRDNTPANVLDRLADAAVHADRINDPKWSGVS